MFFYLTIILVITGIVGPEKQYSGNSVAGRTEQSIAVPAKLLAFTGKADGTSNVLQWQTAAEVKVREFIIERSADGTNFELFAWITPKGSFNVAAFYRYTDTTAAGPETFYRLRMVDTDGAEQVSRIISVAKKAAK